MFTRESGGMTMSEAQSEAKNYLAVELGNQKRFLYEYGYSQIVDILAKGGFLRLPEHPSNKSVLEEK